MTAQINLYNPAFIPPRRWVSAKALALTSVCVVLLMSSWATWALFQDRKNAARLAQGQAEQQQIQAKVQQLQEAAQSPQSDPAQQAALAASRAAVARQAALLAQTQNWQRSGRSAVPVLRALSRQSQSGIWLTGLRVSDGGRRIDLRGHALDPQWLTTYVQGLQREAAFSGRAFSGMQVSFQQAPPAAPAMTTARAASSALTFAAATSAHNGAVLEFELQALSAAAESLPP